MSNSKTSLKRLAVIAGIIGSVFYFFILTVLGLLWTGYNPISQHMSELGGVESPYKNMMNIFGFMEVGVMIMIFGAGFIRGLRAILF